jgi:hypothetical protein
MTIKPSEEDVKKAMRVLGINPSDRSPIERTMTTQQRVESIALALAAERQDVGKEMIKAIQTAIGDDDTKGEWTVWILCVEAIEKKCKELGIEIKE